MIKKAAAIITILIMLLSLCACSDKDSGVNVQKVGDLASAASAGERFAGMVVSENIEKIQKDSNKTVLELYVSAGDKVKKGDKLFTYDSDSLNIELEKLKLELDKTKEEKRTHELQLESTQSQLDETYDEDARVRLSLELNTIETEIMEADYQIKVKKKEIKNMEKTLKNIHVKSPIDGTVSQIDEEGTSGAYITIHQSGAFRIKGSVNELNLNAISPGASVKIFSRVDPDKNWMGTVSNVEMQNEMDTSTNNGGAVMMSDGDAIATTSTYPFYVDLENPEGLLLGQHVYMEVVSGGETGGLSIPENYLMDIKTDDETGVSKADIWIDMGGKLGKLNIELIPGQTPGTYDVLSGVEADDYIADPADPGCKDGAKTILHGSDDFTPADADSAVSPDDNIPEDGVSEEELPESDMPASDADISDADTQSAAEE